MIHATDEKMELIDLYKNFVTCKSLTGKPKIFFVQSVGGVFPGITMKVTSTPSFEKKEIEELKEKAPFVIPSMCDLLLVFSPNGGQTFIRALSKEFREKSKTHELMKILTSVVSHVVHCKQRSLGTEAKEMPRIFSTLTKNFYFKS